MSIIQTMKSKLAGVEPTKEKQKPKKSCSTSDFCEKVVDAAAETAERSKRLAGKMQSLIDHGF